MSAPAHNHALTTGPIARTLIIFSLPILGSNVLQSLNVSVNSIWIGHFLGEAQLTASSNANLVLFLLLGSVFGISMASTILIGQAMGARKIDEAKRVFGTGVTFFVGLATAGAIVGYIFAPELLTLMRTPPDALPYAIAYLRVIFIALPAMYFYILLRMTLRGAGDSHTPFWFMVLSVIIDISLNPLLIFGWGPVPALGIAGSALATLIAQVVALVGLLTYMYRRKHFLWLHRHEWHYLKPDWHILKSMIVKGLPMGMQMIVISSSGLVLITLINVYGSEMTAAYGAALQLWRYIQMPSLAVGSAVASMAAQNVGAGLWHRVDRLTGAGVAYNLVMTGILVAVILIFSHEALGLFLPGDSHALAMGQHLNAIVVWAFVCMSITFVLFGVIRSTGAVIPPLVILVISLWGLRIPFAWVMREYMGPDAVWWSYPLASACTLIMALVYYRFGRWREAKMMKPPRAQVSTLGSDEPVVSPAPQD
ncbi:MAG TPA: MATE family efflux transporter [Oleiagrimonas sp.]|nr:MATE family efflux transporter [Oleiagrimonas sp.]